MLGQVRAGLRKITDVVRLARAVVYYPGDEYKGQLGRWAKADRWLNHVQAEGASP